MSYTAPAWDEAILRLTGNAYAPPSATEADLEWDPGTPTVRWRVTTGCTFRAGFSFSSAVTVSVNIEHPFRDFSLPVTTAAAFSTDLRRFDISATAGFDARPGFRALIDTSVSFSPSLLGVIYSGFSIPVSAGVAPVGQWNVSLPFESRVTARLYGAATYNKPMAMRVRNTVTFDPRPLFLANSVFTQPVATGFSGRAAKGEARAPEISATGSAVFWAQSLATAAMSSASLSSAAFVSQDGRGGAFAIAPTLVAAFASSYDTVAVAAIDPDADTVFVNTCSPRVAVLTQ